MKEPLKILLIGNTKRQFLTLFLIRLLFVIVAVLILSPPAQVYAQTAQRITVTGTVSDIATGQLMPGVNVVLQGTTVGTTTDVAGKYTINVPGEQSALVFSFIGYTPQTVVVGRQRVIALALKAEATTLEEVVVVGYGVQKKESVVGAVTQASGTLIKSTVQGADLGNALTGQLPGLVTISTNGVPGGSDQDDDYALMYIRGQKTWNNASPLVLVDGVERPLQNVNPYEIEKISILKDASATAVFGVKGANGVIMITTLRGKEGKPVFSLDMTGSAKSVSRLPHLEGSYIANKVKNYAILNELPVSESSWSSVVPNRWLDLYKSQKYPYYLPDVDWKKQFLNDYGYDDNVNLNVSGGTKYVKYFAALGYTYEGDIFKIQDYGQGYSPNFSFSRYNYRTNLDFDLTKTTRFTANFSGYFANQARPSGDEYRGFSNLYSQPPDLWPAQYADGAWGDYAGYARFANGILGFNFNGQKFTKTTNINTDFILDQKLDVITKGLSINGKLSYDNTAVSLGPNTVGYGRVAKWINPNIVDDPALHDNMTAAETALLESKLYGAGPYTTWLYPATETTQAVPTGYNWTNLPNTFTSETGDNANTFRNIYYQFSVNYLRDFGKHSVSALALMSRQIQAKGSNFPSYREDWVGRVTYNYNRRYLIEFNAAYNGSEKFAPKYRFGFFPSMALGWVVSNEKFFEPVKHIMNNLKFRYSDGKVGSDEGTPRWLYVGDWTVMSNPGSSTTSENVMRFGYPTLVNSYPLRYEGVIPNPDIQWETAHKQDFAVETGFFNDAVKMSFDYFTEDRTNIFMSGTDITVPSYFGAKPVSANLGHVQMHGWEFELNITKTLKSGWTFWLNHSWTFAKDKIIARADPLLKPDYQKQAGYQIGQPRQTVNQTAHPLQTWNEVYNSVLGNSNTYVLPGDFACIDYNSDGVIDVNDNIPYGYPSRPQFTYAPSAGISWKDISANVRFYGVYNVEGEAGTYAGTYSNQFSILYPLDYQNSWMPELNQTTNAIWPGIRYISSGMHGYIPTSRAYLKLQHAEIGYNLPAKLVKKFGMTRFRILLSGDNLILWSKMTEDLDSDRPTIQTNTRRTYPKMKRYNIGLSIGF